MGAVKAIGIDVALVNLELLKRITIEPGKCGGRPCIRGMRIRVIDIIDLYAASLSAE